MVDYAKKTVAELQEILKSRSLPHTGKKAELVARLNEADQAAAENGTLNQNTSNKFLWALVLRSPPCHGVRPVKNR